MKSKEASGKACEIWMKLGLRGNFSNSAKWVGHLAMFEKLSYPSATSILVIFELVTTHYQTLRTWISLNVTHYHNLITLLHALPHTLPYIFSEICVVLGYWQRVTTRYRYFFKKILIYFFINLMVIRGK